MQSESPGPGAPAHYLVADIGATNARFSWGDSAGLRGAVVRVRTRDFQSSEALVETALGLLEPAVPSAIALAVAGPVVGGRGSLTNAGLEFDAALLAARLGCPVTVLNDFHAVARALPELDALMQIGGGPAQLDVKAAIGPGTGLGMGLLVPENGRWRVLASEGGHGDLAPGTPLEAEILAILQRSESHVSWEKVLSGRGLVRLYRAVCTLWGAEPEDLRPEQITARGVDAAEPVCHQTLELFFALLGAAAGNLAVTVCARGGVYVAGGIVPALAEFAATSPLRRRFEERGPMTEMVRAIPLFLILDPAPGLTGALTVLRG